MRFSIRDINKVDQTHSVFSHRKQMKVTSYTVTSKDSTILQFVERHFCVIQLLEYKNKNTQVVVSCCSVVILH